MTWLIHFIVRLVSYHFLVSQVLDPNPFPGLSVSPLHGVVPVGGTAELMVSLTPGAIMKFDTHVQVAIRGGKTLELRMGGTVEPPCVDIDLVRGTHSCSLSHEISMLYGCALFCCG